METAMPFPFVNRKDRRYRRPETGNIPPAGHSTGLPGNTRHRQAAAAAPVRSATEPAWQGQWQLLKFL